jgi:hypothetical protein
MSNQLPEKIPPCAANLLARKEWFADPQVVHRARLGVTTGLSWLLSSPLFAGRAIGAITLNHVIHFRVMDNYDPHSPQGLAFLAHELKHVEQFEREGLIRFYLKYLWFYIQHGYGQLVPSEAEAYELQNQVEAHLAAEFNLNPGRSPCLEMADPHTPNAAFVKAVPAEFQYRPQRQPD